MIKAGQASLRLVYLLSRETPPEWALRTTYALAVAATMISRVNYNILKKNYN